MGELPRRAGYFGAITLSKTLSPNPLAEPKRFWPSMKAMAVLNGGSEGMGIFCAPRKKITPPEALRRVERGVDSAKFSQSQSGVNRFVPLAGSSACEMLGTGHAIFASPLRRAGWGPILDDCCGWRLGSCGPNKAALRGGRLLPLSPLALASQTPDDSPCGHAERHSFTARRACPPRCACSACARRAAHSVTRAMKSAEDLEFLGFRDRFLDAPCGPSGGEDPITGTGFTL